MAETGVESKISIDKSAKIRLKKAFLKVFRFSCLCLCLNTLIGLTPVRDIFPILSDLRGCVKRGSIF